MEKTAAEKRHEKALAEAQLRKYLADADTVYIERSDQGQLSDKRWKTYIIDTSGEKPVIRDISREIALVTGKRWDRPRWAVTSVSFHSKAEDIQQLLETFLGFAVSFKAVVYEAY